MFSRLRWLRVAVAGLVLAVLVRGNCKFRKVGDWYGIGGNDAFVALDDKGNPVKTIKIIKIKGLTDPTVVVENYDGKQKEISYSSYTDAVHNCHANSASFWPDWFTKPEGKLSFVRQASEVPVVTASSDLDGDDLDGDGDADLVSVRFFQGATVSRGDGSGNFVPTRVVYPTGPGPETLLLADLDGDGQKDLLVADAGNFGNDAGKLGVLLGLRDGTFATAVRYDAGVAPRAVTTGDFNGDGKLDVAVASAGNLGSPSLPTNAGSVAILLGNGDGSLRAATLLPAGEAPISILATDFNGDAKLDLAVAMENSDSVSVFRGNGDGTFQSSVNTAVGTRPSFLGSADFNGDGRADLAVLHKETATISMWMNNPSGSFISAGRYLAGNGAASFAIASSPVDERPTILSPDMSGARFLLLGTDLDGALVAAPSYPVGRSPSGIAVADFDGNQQLDLAVASSDGIQMILNAQPRQFPQPAPRSPIAGSKFPASSIVAGDFTGDGIADLAATGSNTFILAGNGDGAFRPPVDLAGSSSGSFIGAADVNVDQRLDLIVLEDTRPRGNVAVYLASSGGGFARTAYPVGLSPRDVTVGDFNGDGRPDLAVANFGDLTGPAGVSLLLAVPGGGFQPAIQLDAGLSINTVAAADFNGDGRIDLAAAGQLTSNFLFGLRMLMGNGAGGFQAMPDLETTFGPADLAAEDFNGDGLLDLAVSHCCGTTDMSLLLGNGDGAFRTLNFPGGSSPYAIAPGDFNNDGVPDLAVIGSPTNGRSGTATILDIDVPGTEHVSAASGWRGDQAADSILSAFGAKLATETVAAPTPEWPAVLGGTRVQIRDSAGVEHDAGVAFVSPGQVNYHLPPGTATGPATITITASNGHAVSTVVDIVRIAPGLFQATSGGVAAAWVIRVKPDGQQILEPVVQLNAANEVVAAPIDLSSDTDVMVLQLYGTGVRGRLNLSDVRIRVGTIECTVLYAGEQTQFPGLDQINVELPKTLRGAGLVDVVTSVEDQEVNILKIRFR